VKSSQTHLDPHWTGDKNMKTLTLAALILPAPLSPHPCLACREQRQPLHRQRAARAALSNASRHPRHGYVWAPGHWNWNGHRHVWAPGYWIAERPGYVYNAPVWYQDNGGWMHAAGALDRLRPGYDRGRDRDRDGVPDRYECAAATTATATASRDRYEHGRMADAATRTATACRTATTATATATAAEPPRQQPG
jgi:hypothetical protein